MYSPLSLFTKCIERNKSENTTDIKWAPWVASERNLFLLILTSFDEKNLFFSKNKYMCNYAVTFSINLRTFFGKLSVKNSILHDCNDESLNHFSATPRRFRYACSSTINIEGFVITLYRKKVYHSEIYTEVYKWILTNKLIKQNN